MGRSRKNKGRSIDGILIFDKPLEITSNTALQKVKRIFNANKAGHTGSLDRMASGLLPICLGEATKLSSFLLDSNKHYTAKAKLGVRTNTADAEGEVIEERKIPEITEAFLEHALSQFRGDIEQIPPMFSALKVNGQRLYELAYKGEEVERQPRPVTIYELILVSFTSDSFTIDVTCSKGTYIRTLVEDIGEVLGCGAHVDTLRRLRAGPFHEEDMVSLEALESRQEQGFETLDELLWMPDQAVLHIPEVSLDESSTYYVMQGQAVRKSGSPTDGLVRLYDHKKVFLGIGKILDDGRVAPKRLFNLHDHKD